MSIKSLYVHTLDDSVFEEVNKSFNQKCCDNNLQINYDPNLTSLYVGYTGIGVNERIQQHKEGYKSSKWMGYASYPPKGLGLVYKASAHHNLLSKLDELELGYELANLGHLVFGPSFGDLKEFNISVEEWIKPHLKGNFYKARSFDLEKLIH